MACRFSLQLSFFDTNGKSICKRKDKIADKLPLPDPNTGRIKYKCLKVPIYHPGFLKAANTICVEFFTEPKSKTQGYFAARVTDVFLRIIPKEFYVK